MPRVAGPVQRDLLESSSITELQSVEWTPAATSVTFPIGHGEAPSVEPGDHDRLVKDLSGSIWQTARELRRLGWNERKLRAVASLSRGRIVSGQKGYALIESVSDEEAMHAAAWLDAQARVMMRRANEIRQCRRETSI